MSEVRILCHEDQEWVLKSEYNKLSKALEVAKGALNEIEEILCAQTYNDAFEVIEKSLKQIEKIEKGLG